MLGFKCFPVPLALLLLLVILTVIVLTVMAFVGVGQTQVRCIFRGLLEDMGPPLEKYSQASQTCRIFRSTHLGVGFRVLGLGCTIKGFGFRYRPYRCRGFCTISRTRLGGSWDLVSTNWG